jgi:hypothetical protein
MAAAKKVRAVTTFAAEVDGSERLVAVGEEFAASDPVVKSRTELFEPAEQESAPKRAAKRPK